MLQPGASNNVLLSAVTDAAGQRSPLHWMHSKGTVNAMARTSQWAGKILALLRSGNTSAAVAQIKVAPSVKDLKALQTAVVQAGLIGRWNHVDAAITDNIDALAAPRLHRSP
jgi:hypothetical protein